MLIMQEKCMLTCTDTLSSMVLKIEMVKESEIGLIPGDYQFCFLIGLVYGLVSS